MWAGDGFVGFWTKKSFHDVWSHYKKAQKSNKLHPILKHHDRENFTLFLIDEVEKMHPDITQALLGAFDEGKISIPLKMKWNNEYKNVSIDLTNTFFMLTSNIWQQEIRKVKENGVIGFAPLSKTHQKEMLDTRLKEFFSPEFLWRVTKIIPYEDITKDHCKRMIEDDIERANSYFRDYFQLWNVNVGVSDKLVTQIIERGFTKNEWARPLLRTLKEDIYLTTGRILKDNNFEEYIHTRNPSIIFFDLNQEQEIVPRIITTNIVPETPLYEDPVYEEIQTTADIIQEVLIDTIEYSAILSRLSENYWLSDREVDVLSELQHSSIEATIFECENDRQPDFINQNKDLFANLWPRTVQKVIQSKAKVLQQERSYSKESYILQVITKSIISIQDHYGLDRLSEEENEAMINMAVYAAIKNLQTQKVFTQ